MNIQEITSRDEWDAFVLPFSDKTFLHAWQWGEMHKESGGEVYRLGVYDDKNRLNGVALILKIVARRGSFLFCPHGPLLHDWRTFDLLFNHLQALGRSLCVDFVRISPYLRTKTWEESCFQRLGFRNAPIHMHAETTWTLDLSPTEDSLLAGMKKTMRNLVRRGTKDCVTIQFGTDASLVDTFYTLHATTVQLQDFVPFSKPYIEREVSLFSPDEIMVAIASHNGKPLAGAVVPIYEGTGFYHHGASVHSKVPAAYTLQWEIIRELKRRGCMKYNFWGIAPTESTRHPWHGLSQFKMGFGGYRTDYVHAQDYPLTWKYWLNYAVETARRLKRGY